MTVVIRCAVHVNFECPGNPAGFLLRPVPVTPLRDRPSHETSYKTGFHHCRRRDPSPAGRPVLVVGHGFGDSPKLQRGLPLPCTRHLPQALPKRDVGAQHGSRRQLCRVQSHSQASPGKQQARAYTNADAATSPETVSGGRDGICG